MSIENAAAAFDRDMGNTKSLSSGDVSGKPAPAEPIFTNLGDLEVDDDSPALGGGDDFTEEPRKPKVEARKPAPKGDEEDEDDAYSDFTDEELEALGRPPREPKEGDGEDEDEDQDEDELLSREFSVMVDGEETKVSLKDALNNYSHRAAVDQRMNFVNEGRRMVAEEAQNVIAMRQSVDAKLAEAEAILAALVPAEPDWDKLFAENPANARALQKQYDSFKAKVDEIKNKRKENAAADEQSDLANTRKFRDAEARKFAGYAKWDSAKARDKDMASMFRTARTVGFSEQEIGQVLDSRMLVILHKASKYDRMMAAKPRPVNTRQQQSDTPGANGVRRPAPKGNDRAMRNLQRTGSVEAAADVFRGILKRG